MFLSLVSRWKVCGQGALSPGPQARPVPPGEAASHSWTVASHGMEGVRVAEMTCGPGAACSACIERSVARPSGWRRGSGGQDCSHEPHVLSGLNSVKPQPEALSRSSHVVWQLCCHRSPVRSLCLPTLRGF